MSEEKEYYKIITHSRNSILVRTPKYKLHYEKGSIVNKVEETVGIFIFNSLTYTIQYKNSWGSSKSLIVKVRPIGEVKHINIIASGTTKNEIDTFYSDKNLTGYCISTNTMPNSMCCDSLEVIE